MQIVSFSEFSQRRAAKTQPDVMASAAPAYPVVDRWAALHAPGPDHDEYFAQDLAATPEREPAGVEADFWNDLQFRIAYPTHKMRYH